MFLSAISKKIEPMSPINRFVLLYVNVNSYGKTSGTGKYRMLTSTGRGLVGNNRNAVASTQTTCATTDTITSQIYSPIYVAATRQHVGKTTTSLALMNGLMERFPNRVGFIKPVGQQSVVVSIMEIMVDKDAALVKQYFKLDNISYEHISPVLIPAGYTRDYLDGKITSNDQIACIQNAFSSIQSCSDVVLCEGTGHVAVGSIGTFIQ
jgi:AAA domain